jgi:trimeric autotransporter adhesin
MKNVRRAWPRLSVSFVLLSIAASPELFAQSGFVRSGEQAIPGAVVAAKQDSHTISTVSDQNGRYLFPQLGSGTWAVTVEMFGFESLTRDVDYSAVKGPVNFDLRLKESPLVKRLQQFTAGRDGASRFRNRNTTGQQFDQELQNALNSQQQSVTPQTSANAASNESFLISGSLSPGMAQNAQPDSGPSTIAQTGLGLNGFGAASGDTLNAPGFAGSSEASGFSSGGFGGFKGRGGFGGAGPGSGRNGRGGRPGGAQFGNRRRKNQIRGQVSFTLANSVANAKPFSLNGLDIPQAAYGQGRFSFIVGGPLSIPKIVNDRSTQFFITYFGTRARNPELFTETVPTPAERDGSFSHATQSLGTTATKVPVTVFNPATHQPFAGNVIPASMLNPIALKLLRYYPLPNEPGNANNYQYETAQVGNTDNVGLRLQRNITKSDRLSGNFQYQDRNGTAAQPFGYSDTNHGYGINARLQWTRNLTSTALSNAQIRFNRNTSRIMPFFSLGPDVAAELGIPGTSSNPSDYGPPTLNFTNFAPLSDQVATLTRNHSQSATESISVLKGAHSITLGTGYTRADLSTRTDPNGRGTFNFTGLATSALRPNGQPVPGTGYDLADFLLGYPQSSSIRYGSTSNYFLQNQWNGYAQDEWKLRPSFTLLLGVRYEYFSPVSEKYGRMANLDIASAFTNVAVVTPNQPGPYTGAFGSGLINPDYENWSPRVALAWKIPGIKRSTIFRAGYGIYYNGQAYIQFGSQLAQQPPFATSNNVNTSATNVLTLQKGFLTTSPRDITNTLAVDRFYRTPYAGTWNATLEHDLPGGVFVELGYLGTKGTRLDVKTLPNQAPPGSGFSATERNQLGKAVGFTYDSSVGNSIFNTLQVRAVRRFNRGISVNVFYQFAKSIDDSSTFGGVGNTVAQNWLNIAAERGLSSFDVRHELNASFVWTSPIGAAGSRFAPDTKIGRLLKDWQLSGTITVQSGNPLTARVLGNTAQLAQTGGIGSQRAEATGQPIARGSGFFNFDAFTVPRPGVYGDAGRNTIPGPGLFTFNLAFARSLQLGERRRLEFRVEGDNVLNHVNYTSLYTVVNAVNYGLPSAAGAMRTLDAVVRFRF